MGNSFEQSGLDRTQAQFDAELRKMSWEKEGEFTYRTDTSLYSEAEIFDLADRFVETEWESQNRRIMGYDEAHLELLGMNFEQQPYEPESKPKPSFVLRCKRLGSAILSHLKT